MTATKETVQKSTKQQGGLKLYVFFKQNNVIVTYNVNENEYIKR